ncbi:hypothetical protein [Chitinophaga costaii]|uniref:hypothetical protein n=1 Tax=Chitinophaga costaii TaxID=1335309 RepID=UPI000F50A9AD|nr:hypothetical protein [Chitinophaga costaii]
MPQEIPLWPRLALKAKMGNKSFNYLKINYLNIVFVMQSLSDHREYANNYLSLTKEKSPPPGRQGLVA